MRARWLAVVLAVPGACGGDDGPAFFRPLDKDARFPGNPESDSQFEALFRYDPVAECAAAVPRKLGGAKELRVFRHRSVTDADLRFFLGGLRRYYDQYGVRMFTRHLAIDVPFDHALTLDIKAITAYAQSRTKIDLRRDVLTPAEEAEVLRLVGEAIFFNVREFLRVYGQPRLDQVNVWLLPQVAAGNPEDPDLKMLAAVVAGLGLSPELLDSAPPDDPARQLYDWVGTKSFTPAAMVGVKLVRSALRYPDIVIAHEVGHAFGLIHTTAMGNLLNQGQLDCNLALSAAQIDQVEQVTRRAVHVLPRGAGSLTGRAHHAVAAVRAAIRRSPTAAGRL